MVQTVCLDENKHATSLLLKLKKMKGDATLCDFIIKVNGVEYPTHRNILSAGSSYFEAMFSHSTKENLEGKVEMRDVDAECVKSCVEFIYSGKFDIPDGKIGDLLHVAVMLQLDDMKIAISGILEHSLNVENFFLTRDVAELYDFEIISEKCKEFYAENFIQLSLQPGFANEKKFHLRDIFKSKKLDLSEEEKLAVSLRWIGDREIKQDLYDLIKVIDLHAVPADFLQNLLDNDPVVSNDLRLYKILSSPLLKPAVLKNVVVKKRDTNADRKKKASDGNCQSIIIFDEDRDCLHSYNPITDDTAKFHNEKFTHLKSFSATCLDSYIYALCGNKEAYRLNFKYKNSKWEKIADTIVDHGQRPSQIALLGSLFVVGGISKDLTTLKSVEQFDPNKKSWVRLKDKPAPIAATTLVPSGDIIYCIGGMNENCRDSKAFSKFTPSSKHWADLPPMKTAKSNCGAVAIGYKIYVTGGWRNSNVQKNLELFDVALSQWTVLKPMLKRHAPLKVYYENGHIFAICSSFSDEAEKYHVENDEWSKVTMKGLGKFKVGNSVSF